jgi:hypothetical protein
MVMVPPRLNLLFTRLLQLRKAPGLWINTGLSLLFFFFLSVENRDFPRYQELQQVNGEFEKCGIFAGGKQSSYLAIQLKEKGIFTIQQMYGQSDFSELCKYIQQHKEIPVRLLFEDSDYDHSWSAFVIAHKKVGSIWELQQGTNRLIKYPDQLSIREANKKGVVILLSFLMALTGSLSIWGIKDIIYPRKRSRKQ